MSESNNGAKSISIDKYEKAMAINLKALNEKQLIELIRKAEQQKLDVAKENLTRVREQIHNLLKSEGLTLGDLFEQPSRVRRSTSTKYRNASASTRKRSGNSKRPG